MKKTVTITIIAILYIFSCKGQKTDSDGVGLIQIFESYNDQIQEIEKELSDSLVEFETDLQKSNDNIKKASSNNQRIKYLTEQVALITEQNETKKELEIKREKKRFEAGGQAISAMENGVAIINFTQNLLDLEQTIGLSTNLWSDTSLSNVYNKIEDWGEVVGAAIAGISILSQNDEVKGIEGSVVGVGVIAVSQAIGNLFGMNEKKIRKKLELIDLSKRAFDDLTIRNSSLIAFLEKNADFVTRLSSFKLEYSNTSSKMTNNEKLAVLMGYLDEYNYVLKQIPIFLDDIISVGNGYINNKKLYKELPMKDIFSNINKKAEFVKKEYNQKVKPLLDISPKIKKDLFAFS